MSDIPDMEALARRYLDLWQDQMARMANDPATSDMLARTFTLMTRSARMYSNPGGSTADDGGSHSRKGDDVTTASGAAGRGEGASEPATGAEAATAVSGAGGVEVSELLRRIDALEKRVAELEGRRGSTSRTRKRSAP